MKNISKLIALSFLLFSIVSCEKDDGCDGGTGGKNSLKVYLKHHSKIIPPHANYPDTLFIKYGSSELPGTSPSDFDNYVVNSDTTVDFFSVPNLKCGDYYLYGVGWDAAISQRVKGGVPVTIPDNDAEVSVNVPVTED